MKKLFFTGIFILAGFIATAQTKNLVENSIYNIEETKSQIYKKSQTEKVLKDKQNLFELYRALELQLYTINNKKNDIMFSISEYDIEKECWMMNFKVYLCGSLAMDFNFPLRYHHLMNRKYVPVAEMTERQIQDYEFYVNEYDKKLKENPELLTAELDFKVFHWLQSSEYNFIPAELKITLNERHPKTIIAIGSNDLETKLFTIEPQIEIRTSAEQKADIRRINRLSNSKQELFAEQEEEVEKPYPGERGRRALYINLNTEVKDFADPEFVFYKEPPSNVTAVLSWGFNKYIYGAAYAGAGFGNHLSKKNFTFGLDAGVNFLFKNHVRPYIKGGSKIATDDTVEYNAGGGIDFLTKNIMFSLEYTYNWQRDLFKYMNDTFSRYHTYGICIGFSW